MKEKREMKSEGKTGRRRKEDRKEERERRGKERIMAHIQVLHSHSDSLTFQFVQTIG